MNAAERDAAIWWQEDARHTYAAAAEYRDQPGAGPWVASQVQAAAAWSSAHARALLCGTPPPTATPAKP